MILSCPRKQALIKASRVTGDVVALAALSAVARLSRRISLAYPADRSQLVLDRNDKIEHQVMRNFSGWTSAKCASVTLDDRRAAPLTRLLEDLARPGLCLMLGAGASHGVVPISKAAVMEAVRDLHEAKGNVKVLPAREQALLADPMVNWVVSQLPVVGERFFDAAWPMIERSYERNKHLGSAHASIIIHETFTPKGNVPPELSEIYKVLESTEGTLITYNYDRVEGADSGFRVIAPHGQRSKFTLDPVVWADAQRIALQTGRPIPTDIHLPEPEHEGVRERPAYEQMVQAWRKARCVVLIGYGFGAGDDELSFDDFGRTVGPTTAVHVINPDFLEVAKQVGYALKGRGRDGRVRGHNFKWRPLAAAILDVLHRIPADHVRLAIGHEREICDLHDRGCPTQTAHGATTRRQSPIGSGAAYEYTQSRDAALGVRPRNEELDPDAIREGESDGEHFFRVRLSALANQRATEAHAQGRRGFAARFKSV